MEYVLFVIGLLCIVGGVLVMLLNSGTMFFAVWYVLGAAFLLAAWMTKASLWSVIPAPVRAIGAAAIGVLALVLALTTGLAVSQLRATGEPDLDYVVVLGAQIYNDGSPSPSLRFRLEAALKYLQENPRTRCIVSGGKGSNEPYPEAQGMAAWLEEHGISPDRIIQEGRSTNTKQNITYSMALMDSADARVGIVTNDFHVYRATRIAVKAGLKNACGIAAYSTPLYLPNNLLRESLGIVKDFIVGNI